MKIKFFVAVFILVSCSSCSLFIDEPTRIVLKHPETLDFVNCNVDQWDLPHSYKNNEECVEDYKKKGYFVWDKR